MHDHTLGLTPSTYGDVLPPTNTANVRGAPEEGRGGEGRGGEGREGVKGYTGFTGACTIACRRQSDSPISWVEYDIITIQELFLTEVNTRPSSELVNGICYGRLCLNACKNQFKNSH